MRMRVGAVVGITVAAVVTAMTLGCSPQPSAVAAVLSDKVYTVLPVSVKVKAGIVTGEMTELKVTERIEQDSGRVAYPAKLTGKLVLRNTSTDQTVRLIGGSILYIDAQGQLIKLEENRTEPTIRVDSRATDRLDPGQDATQDVDVDFPAEALKLKKLREIRLALSYIPTPFKEETLRFVVSIGEQPVSLR